jgi:indole-3-glycerol phosphate synthase / phosphoribosylanthranilate isomerase
VADSVLAAIVERKRSDVEARLQGVSLDSLRSSAEPTRRSLKAALAKAGARFILEVKRASPSQGQLRAAAEPEAIARSYAGVADAISVLTDTPYFQGSLDDLARVRSVFDGPILAKDFIVDLRQVAEARIQGADAVLAMLSVLSAAEAAELLIEAKRLGMHVIVEVHDEAELEIAIALGAPIIGINNRNLKTLEVDLAVTERLAPKAPADRILIAESGIRDRRDVERLSPHVDAFLVGTSLMRAEDPAQAARELAFGRVKACGLTRADDARLAAEGATYGGIIFVPGSPRYVGAGEAIALAQAVHGAGLKSVGVFRNERLMRVAQMVQRLGLDVVQLHGEEGPDYIAGLRNLIGADREIWAASPVSGASPLRRTGADRTLYDNVQNGRCGGTGLAFDWNRLGQAESLGRDLVAGGLSPVNAAEAARLGAFALDVNSGVESAPGRKDPEKMRAFFEALRPAGREALICA